MSAPIIAPASPLPWRRTGACSYVDANGRPLVSPAISREDDEQNRAYSLAAANALPALVEALAELEKRFADKCAVTCMYSLDLAAMEKARAAIVLVRKEKP